MILAGFVEISSTQRLTLNLPAVDALAEKHRDPQLDRGLAGLHVVDRRAHRLEAVLEAHESVIGRHGLQTPVSDASQQVSRSSANFGTG